MEVMRVQHEGVPYGLRVSIDSWPNPIPIECVFKMAIGAGARAVRLFRLTFRWCGKRVNHWRRPRRRARR